jgi:hypothetical protein
VIREHDMVVLTRDFEAQKLERGDVGAVVHVYGNNEAYEVEFVTADGKTVALLTLSREDIRPMAIGEILHVREFTAA